MNGQKPLLVVIDDEQGILDVVSRFAQRAGYEALACSNGRARCRGWPKAEAHRALRRARQEGVKTGPW